jgi:uncharacterized membrane protein
MDSNERADKDLYDNGHDDPANWKWGMFYFNPKDKRLFPPKRREWAGWTINFANMGSVIAFILVFTLIILFSLWLNAQAM